MDNWKEFKSEDELDLIIKKSNTISNSFICKKFTQRAYDN